MIAKASRNTADARGRKAPEPVEIELSLRFRFGDKPEEQVTVMNQRRVPLVGSVFDKRDAIFRAFGRLIVQAAKLRPRVAAQVFPFKSSSKTGPRGRKGTKA